MEDLLRALLFIGLFAGVFIGTMVIENLWAKRRGVTKLYHFPETFTNLMTGASYKIVDGIAIALFIQLFYDWVYQFGFQWNPEVGVVSIIALILFIDLCMYAAHYLMHKIRWFWNAHVTHHSSEHMNFSTALRQNFTYAFSGTWILWWIPAAFVGFDKTWTLIAIEANLV
ncbi:MAG: sterol desaturase family protein, partial [Pseudomonadota bacterium]|nr:sterol desaturase family protein [Pseudomonadota bacterium]